MMPRFLARYSLIFCLLGLSTPSLSTDNTANLQQIEAAYQELLVSSYRELSSNSSVFKLASGDFKNFVQQVKEADKSNNAVKVIGLITANLDLIGNNTDSNDLQTMTRALLRQQATGIAQKILDIVAEDGNTYMLGRIQFEFARHHAAMGHWNEAFAQLGEIDIVNTLEKEDGDEAFVILGSALQHRKQHRQALGYYARVTPQSIHYPVAQLNTAIAYIRQDWWTDAHIAIKNALKNKSDDSASDELRNRLYTVMGFSQIQHGFYRDARESFRNVHIKSQYMNRALLGLGMAALHQEDFIGALNAFNHLKQGSADDISVLESYLLAAFSLEKLGQQKTASASYTEAITFYEQQSALYQKNLTELANLRNTQLIIQPAMAAKLNADLQRIQPGLSTLSKRLEHLNELKSQHISAATQTAISRLIRQLSSAYADQAIEGLETKQSIINNYLSQSRFGLAKLYDTQ